ncbi:MAG: protein O-mannosyl-transferase family [Candidatus Limnocylindrales bacterium]
MTDRIGRWVPPLAVALIAFSATRLAMLPGLGFWDTAELQTVAPVLGTAHPTGFPTYVLLGWLANLLLSPFGEPALRMNLFAGLCVAVAAAVTVDLVRGLTRSVALGVLAGLGLALTEIAWSIGTQAEAHALHLAFVAILFRMLVAWEDRVDRDDRHRDRWLIAAAVVFGLAMGNHSLTLLLAPAMGVFVLGVEPGILRRPWLVAACASALILTVVAVYLELPLRAGPFRAPLVYGRPETWDGFWYVALAEQFRGSVIGPFSELGPKAAELVARTVRAFGPLAILIPIAFLATALSRPRYAVLSGTALAITCFFAASYINADIERYYLGPALIVWTWLAILAGGAASLVGATLDGRARAGIDTGRALRSDHVIAVALAVALLIPTVTALPDRLRRVDRSRDTLARQWVERALGRLAPEAIVLSWWSYSTPLWYAQHVEGRRPDIAIIDDRTRLDEHLGELTDVIDANLPSRAVYVIRMDASEIATLERRYVLEPLDGVTAASLTRVVARREVGS